MVPFVELLYDARSVTSRNVSDRRKGPDKAYFDLALVHTKGGFGICNLVICQSHDQILVLALMLD